VVNKSTICVGFDVTRGSHPGFVAIKPAAIKRIAAGAYGL
jgi:hypothetical protein